MSQAFYNNKWRQAQNSLKQVLQLEMPTKPTKGPEDQEHASNEVQVRYINYTQIYKSLILSYDYIVHPQKRALLEKCIDNICGRIVELREEMVRVDVNEYSFMGLACHDMKFTMQELEMKLSKSNEVERIANFRKRTQMLEYILEGKETHGKPKQHKQDFTVEEAVLLIQRNERMYRDRTKFKRCVKAKKQITRDFDDDLVQDISMKGIMGVTLFQSMWRGHIARKRMDRIRREMDVSLGMEMPARHGAGIHVMEAAVISKRHKQAAHHRDVYLHDYALAEKLVKTEEARGVAFDVRGQIEQWILECRDITNKFPDFPSVEDGGSLKLFCNISIEELTYDMDDMQEAMDNGGGGKEKGKDKGKDKDKGKENDKGKDKKKDDKDKKGDKSKDVAEEYIFRKSKFQEKIQECEHEYRRRWLGRNDEQGHIYDNNHMMDDIRRDVEAVVRREVDELMRQELDRLVKGIDHKPPPKPGKEKKKKEKKEKKKKTMKDLTPGIPIEELYSELVLAEIIKQVQQVPLAAFIGDYNVITDTDAEGIECIHDLADVRKMIFDFGILPMSSSNIHQLAPLTKSLLLVGPALSGKKMLVDAICFELGATLFDLSPLTINEKYEGKSATELLISIVYKVAKSCEPAVIFIDNCDLMFTKPKQLSDENRELNPGRIKKDLMKMLKVISQDDRILLIGATKFPFKANMGQLFKAFSRMIFQFPPSHASRHALWQGLIEAHGGVVGPNFSLTSLTTVSKGFTAGVIAMVVNEVVSENRKAKQHIYPLKCLEFVKRLATYDPIYWSELEAFRDWSKKTPLAKKRLNLKKKAMEVKEGETFNAIPFL